jgi:hypothetical protein
MNSWIRLLDYWDRDWKGQALDGRSLREELLAHPAREAISDRTYEGYTVWGVALHVHRYKEILLSTLEKREAEFPEGDEDFPAVPEAGLTEPKWLEAIGLMDETHEALIGHARTLDEPFLETLFEPWQMSWGTAFTWAAGHDRYHVAQIRNMKR